MGKKIHSTHDSVEMVQGKIILDFIRWKSLAFMLHTGSLPALCSFDNILSISCCGESSPPHAQGYSITKITSHKLQNLSVGAEGQLEPRIPLAKDADPRHWL